MSKPFIHPVTQLGSYHYGRENSAARIAKQKGVTRQWVTKNRIPAPNPLFDEEGYPTNETLLTVQKWPIKSNFAIQDLLAYVEKAWRYKFVVQKGGRGRSRWIRVATSGWSGNESLIKALMDNRPFWICCWIESRRGGSFVFLTSPFQESKT